MGRFAVHRESSFADGGNGMGWYPHCQPIFQAHWEKIEDIYYVCETDIDVLMWLNVFNHKCRQIGQLILRKIMKIVATRCQILIKG